MGSVLPTASAAERRRERYTGGSTEPWRHQGEGEALEASEVTTNPSRSAREVGAFLGKQVLPVVYISIVSAQGY